MSAPGEKKRPWFQFHLSTAVLLMFVASGFLGANMLPDIPRPDFVVDLDVRFDIWGQHLLAYVVAAHPGEANMKIEGYGWPFRYRPRYLFPDVELAGKPRHAFLVLDIALAIAATTIIAVLAEWHIRRKERKS